MHYEKNKKGKGFSICQYARKKELTYVLKKNYKKFGLVLELDYRKKPGCVLDLTSNNPKATLFKNCVSFQKYINNTLKENKQDFGVGKYNEDRTIYDFSEVFSGETRRSIHLGIDLWVKHGTRVFSPMEGVVHSFAYNQASGDYGPTIILKHNLEGLNFYTLYGHLSLDSLNGLYEGKVIKKGEAIAKVGKYPINGNWPSHLHFQIIKNMGKKKGDFPGVASKKEIKKFLKKCPDPNLILQIPYSK